MIKKEKMKPLCFIALALICLTCQENHRSTNQTSQTPPKELRDMAMEGITIEFIFDRNKPTHGDLFLMTGAEDPDFPPEHKQYEQLKSLGLSQIDDAYFGIPNEPGNINNELGFLLIPKQINYDGNAPFDSVLMDYVPLRSEAKRADLVKRICSEFKENLDVSILFEGEELNDLEIINDKIDAIIAYCRAELKVEPGSVEAIALLERDYTE
ncbi:hypothetical protein ESY86_10425 [Subsaximicrobium wynnwilliamsii]|uniref:Uncharacterized protein n=2 Tax=Subsaximicrobium wynnwilliamsii TaxID=291179 RepID=A0A5C6ZG44_9FLAO|nr:hypothetical protein [Subsaximicrobium wynnwilliamsii]TXD88905.1 hypothetical protein ESY86_10425 [Subsaximicrobium wynnwilliamsii]